MGSSMDAGGDGAAGSSGAPRGSRAGGAGQVVQVGASGFVELEGAREGVEDFVGGSGEVATFEAGVVVDADACEQGDLLTAEPGHTPVAAAGGRSDQLRGDLRATRGEEFTDVALGVHPARPGRPAQGWGVLSVRVTGVPSAHV